MSEQWIKLHLSTLDNEVWQDDPTAWRIFEFLLLKAYLGKPKGTTRTTRYKIEKATSVNNSTVYHALARLEKAEMITTSRAGNFTMVSICNWGEYQDKREPVGEHAENMLRTSREHSIKNKSKKENIDTNVSSSTDVDLKALFSELVGLLGFTDAVKYTEGRKRKLQSRVRSSSPDELRRAAQAIADDAYMQGDNPSGRRYGDIDYLIRSDEQVDKWIQKARQQITYQADW